MSPGDHIYLPKSRISRRAFVVAGAGFPGGASVLLYGCENAVNNPPVGNIDGSDNKTLQPLPDVLREVRLDARPAEIEVAPDRRVKAWAYDGKFPGTEISPRERLLKYV